VYETVAVGVYETVAVGVWDPVGVGECDFVVDGLREREAVAEGATPRQFQLSREMAIFSQPDLSQARPPLPLSMISEFWFGYMIRNSIHESNLS
jgi:hypothetical protein